MVDNHVTQQIAIGHDLASLHTARRARMRASFFITSSPKIVQYTFCRTPEAFQVPFDWFHDCMAHFRENVGQLEENSSRKARYQNEKQQCVDL